MLIQQLSFWFLNGPLLKNLTQEKEKHISVYIKKIKLGAERRKLALVLTLLAAKQNNET